MSCALDCSQLRTLQKLSRRPRSVPRTARSRPLTGALLVAGFLAVASNVAAAKGWDVPRTGDDVRAILARLLDARVDPNRIATIDSLTLSRGAARFRFGPGVMCRTATGESPLQMALYVGSGELGYAPPLEFERSELGRHYHTDHLVFPFRTVVLLWADSTGDVLDRALPWGTGKVPGAEAARLDWVLAAISDRKPQSLEPEFMEPLLSGRRTSLFFAYVLSTDDRALFFKIDPTLFEDEQLLRVPKPHFLTEGTLANRVIACQFPSGGQYDSTAIGIARPTVRVPHIELECNVADDLGFSATAALTVVPLRGDSEWFQLELDPVFDVDSLSWDGRPVAGVFSARGHVWVRPGGPLEVGTTHTLLAAYHGPLLEPSGDWILPRTWTLWYPQPACWNFATYVMRFRFPKRYLLTSIGEQESLETAGSFQTSRWTMRRPTYGATFVIGRFEKRSFGNGETQPVHALFYKGKPHQIAWKGTLPDGTPMSIVEGAQMQDWVAKDAARCFAFYQGVLGPVSVPEFTVMQIPALQGEAFPGLVNIPEASYDGATGPAEDVVFRAHEVAHQWWGYSVMGRDYHDHWLSEGFADFFGLLYLQKSLGRGPDYLAILRRWRDQLVEDRATRPEKDHPPGPMWLGTRNATYERPYDYSLIDYKKGAWVLHMLRFLMMNLESLDDASFMAMLQDFFRTYAGKYPTTADFRRTAERYYGGDLGWFFDQWVYGTALPTYEFSYQIARTPEGKSRVTCRVHRKDSSAPFKLAVILRIDFGPGRTAWVRHEIEAADAEFALPLLDTTPVRVTFNDFESALCVVKEVQWK